jgi:tetratricopeptide (TPR) repeat protein
LYGAGAILEKVLENNPKNPDVWLRYIQLRKDTGSSYGDVNQVYTTALEKTERNTDIITSYAQFKEQNGRIQDAVSLWQEAAKTNPSNPTLYQQEIIRLQGQKK